MLQGNAHTLDELATPAWIGRRQQHFNAEGCTLVAADIHKETQEAGLSVLCSNHAWYAVVVSVRDGKRVVIVKKRVEDMWMEIVHILPEVLQDVKCPIELYTDADAQMYYFGYIYNDEKHCVGTGTAKLLSTEVNWGFTGVFIGMYAVGAEAGFRYFKYKGSCE